MKLLFVDNQTGRNEISMCFGNFTLSWIKFGYDLNLLLLISFLKKRENRIKKDKKGWNKSLVREKNKLRLLIIMNEC
jgi:hypothetical protein